MNDTILQTELNTAYPLSQNQLEQYEKDGHILLKDLASPSLISHYRPLIQEEVGRLNRETRPLEERDTYGKAFLQIQNLWEHSEAVRPFVLAKRFAQVAAELMGVSGVRMYHDQALFKEPGGGHTPWHQDQIYWPVDTNKTITLWMPLVDIPAEVGSMTFVSGSHERGYISKLEISDLSHKTLTDYIEKENLPQVNYGGMKAGDATFHAGWTLHSAPGNPTANVREVMTVIYVADGVKVLEPDSNARRSDLKNWMPGLKPGDLIDSPLNPLIYSKN
ncbi:ectoine hydroxylase-related dioxygenase (phytanoyl-CoA dioxygenase family) [Paenibacillus rhizosphaerae]|uniref:Ectoine hydroxylase-related dioxygenase (Phytanoyl-CoA dioxygenase family) n=1 Tax=Paenibacillus rhizosphaerae TaxID=297318 RepID=A0A839TMT5_9BACL|nr:phytanoyl-CoA dioxygenase family protein [Paenibacillus rhizosphaerae]MBB3127040.1 ectoine hydroxylase-related dioxygenase (phytanoyl-CoA dioxygenase family) [Paenibacillus rhizosphaerae]